MNDLTIHTIENELRILDTDLGKELGYANPLKIRELIIRHKSSLEAFGVPPVVGKTSGSAGGRPTEEFYLNKSQGIFITTQAGTPTAISATVNVIKKFDEYERGSRLPTDMQADRIAKLETMLPALLPALPALLPALPNRISSARW